MPGHIPWSYVERNLLAARAIWLATTQPNGRPHVVPVWYTWNGTHIYFVTPRQSQKVRNIEHEPSVIVHLGDGDDVIIVHGIASADVTNEERVRVERLHSEKYVDPHSGARATVLSDSDILFRVDIERIMTWEYGVIKTRTDWQFGRPTGDEEAVGR